MKRTRLKIENPTLILTADWHLREDQPVCRLDNFWEAQWEKVDFISDLQKKCDCPVIHAGDVFNHWKPSPHLLSKTIKHLPKDFRTIFGNHDLPQHNLDLIHKSGVWTLFEAGKLTILPRIHWGMTPEDFRYPEQVGIEGLVEVNNRTILIWHVMTYQGKPPWPGCTDPIATKLLRKYPQYDLIVTGHNHQSFVEKYEGRLLVNPGSLTRHTADQVDHKPRVYIWWAESNTIKPVYLPIEDDVMTREHITQQQERDQRIEAFISRLDDDWEAVMSFEENLERFFQANKIRQTTIDIVHKAIE